MPWGSRAARERAAPPNAGRAADATIATPAPECGRPREATNGEACSTDLGEQQRRDLQCGHPWRGAHRFRRHVEGIAQRRRRAETETRDGLAVCTHEDH